MMASQGAINLYQAAYEIPYSTGLQLLWSAKSREGKIMVALTSKKKPKIAELAEFI